MQPLHSIAPLPRIQIGHAESCRCGGLHRGPKNRGNCSSCSSGAPTPHAAGRQGPRAMTRFEPTVPRSLVCVSLNKRNSRRLLISNTYATEELAAMDLVLHVRARHCRNACSRDQTSSAEFGSRPFGARAASAVDNGRQACLHLTHLTHLCLSYACRCQLPRANEAAGALERVVDPAILPTRGGGRGVGARGTTKGRVRAPRHLILGPPTLPSRSTPASDAPEAKCQGVPDQPALVERRDCRRAVQYDERGRPAEG